MADNGKRSDPKPVPKREVILTPQQQRRRDAVEAFDKAVRLYFDRDLRQAARAFQSVVEGYSDLTDLTRKARQYQAWCTQGREEVVSDKDDRRLQPAGSFKCPTCKSTLAADTSTVSVWCSRCEKYVFHAG